MPVEVDLIIEVLRLTKEGPVLIEDVKRHVRFPSTIVDKLLQKLQKEGLVNAGREMLEASTLQRLDLAIHALKKGADLEKVSGLLQWREFEAMAAFAFENYGYSVTKNLRFKHDRRRHEIDVVACKKPLILCVDCKHWHHSMGDAAMKKIAEEQITRVHSLVKCLPNPKIDLELPLWKSAQFLPMILSLVVDKSKFCSGVPIVPILQVQDFLNQLPALMDLMLSISSSDDVKQSFD